MSNGAQGPIEELPLNVLAIGLLDRPGAAHGVAEVFSGRGLQMEAFHGTAGSLDPDGQAQALILFRADRDRANLVTRVIRRLSSVSRAELLAADDPRLIQSVLIAGAVASAPPGISITALDAVTALATGSPAALQTWLASSVPPRRLGALRLDLRRTDPHPLPETASGR